MDTAINKAEAKVPKRILGALLASVSAGVVPRSGAPYIAIGRTEEVAAMAGDLSRVADGGGAMRFLVGRYGSGKSFLVQLMRSWASENGFVSADADLSPERRLCGTGGVAVATYRELMRNLSSKASPDGGALPVMIARWFSGISSKLAGEGLAPDTPAFDAAFSREIYRTTHALEAGVGGFDFGQVLELYYRAYRAEDEAKMTACLRWLRGEWSTRTEAREALGLRGISVVNDDNWYDYLKLLALFVRQMGYRGLCVFIDEGVNLYKITNRVARESNYEKILAIFNDTLSGRAEGLYVVLGGTPQFLEDPRRGLFSYEALRSRLSDGRFGTEGNYRSLMSPVIRLRRLSDGELYALLLRLCRLHGEFHGWEPRLTPSEMEQFLSAALSRAGADAMITPREIIRDFVMLLDLLLQNPEATASQLMGATVPTAPAGTPAADAPAEEADQTVASVGAGAPSPAGALPQAGRRGPVVDLDL